MCCFTTLIQLKNKKLQQGGIFMKYIMAGRNVEVTQAMKEYAEKRLARIEKFFNEDTEANVTFSVQKKRHILGVTIFQDGYTYRAEATNDDLYVSIDKSIDLLEGQIRKVKTKKERQMKDDSISAKYSHIELPVMTSGEVTKVKTFDTKPMTIEDVMLELKGSDKSFYVFNNSDTNETNVLFRLRDGNFGILEPEK
jgi:putative sigma-54 modulation protein